MLLQNFCVGLCLLSICGGCRPAPAAPPAAAPASAPSPGGELNYDELLMAAQSYLEAGRDVDAALAAAEAARLDDTRPEAFVMWGRALAQSDRLDASAARYEQARHLGSRDPTLFAELASIYDVEKKYEAALAVYRDYLGDHMHDAVMRDEMGMTLLLLDRADEAMVELQRAVDTQATPQFQQDLGYAQLRAGRFAEAQKTLEAVLAREPQRLEAQRFLAQAVAGQGNSALARQMLDTLLAAAPRDHAARQVRARLRALDGAPQLALEDYQVLLAERPADGATALGAAGALIALERLDEAQKAVTKARTSLGEHPQVLFRQAQIDWRRGKLAALGKIEELAAQTGNAQEAWEELAYAAARTHNAALAKRAAGHLRR